MPQKKRKNDLRWVVGMAALLLAVGLGFYFLLFSSSAQTIEIRDEAPWYFPTVLEIEPGTTVKWITRLPAVHPIMTLEGPEEIHSGHFTKEFVHTFTKSGIYIYICPIHPYMKGVIGVGMNVPSEKIPVWANWPLEAKSPPGGLPTIPGEGKIWMDAQFEKVPGMDKPGAIYVINAESWEIETIITDERLNNPHNLIPFGDKILQTNWFDKYLSVIDQSTRKIVQHIFLGESPAHVMPGMNNEKIYVTLQGDDGIAILDNQFNLLEKIRTPKGPHGHMMSGDGKRMALASTEKAEISVWDLETNTIIFQATLSSENAMAMTGRSTIHPHTLPLMAGMTIDGRFAYAATSNEGKFYVFNVDEKKLVKVMDIGKGPIQVGLSPDGKYVVVPLTYDAAAAIISTETWELVKKIPNVGLGAHGVAFGPKLGGGHYAYISNKFTTWVTVINMESFEVAGYIPLPPAAWGGQGITVVSEGGMMYNETP